MSGQMVKNQAVKYRRAQDVDEIRELFRTQPNIEISYVKGKPQEGTTACWLEMSRYSGILDLRPDDLVVTVKSGTTLLDLNQELAKVNLVLPYSSTVPYCVDQGIHLTVGHILDKGLPHALEHRFGPVKDWVTGMTLLLPSGEVAKVGSTVVKSVAGYDLHRAVVGSQGTLALILDVTLRLRPLASFQEPNLVVTSNEPLSNFSYRDHRHEVIIDPESTETTKPHSWQGRLDPVTEPAKLLQQTSEGIPSCFVKPLATTYISRFPRDRFTQILPDLPCPRIVNPHTCTVWTEHPPRHPETLWTLGPDRYLRPTPSGAALRIQRNLKKQFDPNGVLPHFFEPG